MTDLYAGLLVMTGASLAVLAITLRGTRDVSKKVATGIGVGVAALLLLYMAFLWKSAVLSEYLPFSNVAVLCNWFPLAAAFLAGVTWTHGYGTKLRRVLFGAAVFLTSAWSLCDPLLGHPPFCKNQWDSNGICRQSSRFTCTPASAATLLRYHGIPAEESEMAELCLTRDGTTWQGLYRGLTLKTEGHPFRVKVIECEWDDLKKYRQQPLILSVGLDPSEPFPDDYTERRWGWEPGIRHSVILFEQGDGGVLIADPTVGLQKWTSGDLQTLFRGRAVALIPTDGRPG